jgi:hypothetical protein
MALLALLYAAYATTSDRRKYTAPTIADSLTAQTEQAALLLTVYDAGAGPRARHLVLRLPVTSAEYE